VKVCGTLLAEIRQINLLEQSSLGGAVRAAFLHTLQLMDHLDAVGRAPCMQQYILSFKNEHRGGLPASRNNTTTTTTTTTTTPTTTIVNSRKDQAVS